MQAAASGLDVLTITPQIRRVKLQNPTNLVIPPREQIMTGSPLIPSLNLQGINSSYNSTKQLPRKIITGPVSNTTFNEPEEPRAASPTETPHRFCPSTPVVQFGTLSVPRLPPPSYNISVTTGTGFQPSSFKTNWKPSTASFQKDRTYVSPSQYYPNLEEGVHQAELDAEEDQEIKENDLTEGEHETALTPRSGQVSFNNCIVTGSTNLPISEKAWKDSRAAPPKPEITLRLRNPTSHPPEKLFTHTGEDISRPFKYSNSNEGIIRTHGNGWKTNNQSSNPDPIAEVTQEDTIESWRTRKFKILYEMIRTGAEIITLNECDQFHSFFLPCMQLFGYDGIFCPRSNSPGLYQGYYSDGCCIFYKKKRMHMKEYFIGRVGGNSPCCLMMVEIFNHDHITDLDIAKSEAVFTSNSLRKAIGRRWKGEPPEEDVCRNSMSMIKRSPRIGGSQNLTSSFLNNNIGGTLSESVTPRLNVSTSIPTPRLNVSTSIPTPRLSVTPRLNVSTSIPTPRTLIDAKAFLQNGSGNLNIFEGAKPIELSDMMKKYSFYLRTTKPYAADCAIPAPIILDSEKKSKLSLSNLSNSMRKQQIDDGQDNNRSSAEQDIDADAQPIASKLQIQSPRCPALPELNLKLLEGGGTASGTITGSNNGSTTNLLKINPPMPTDVISITSTPRDPIGASQTTNIEIIKSLGLNRMQQRNPITPIPLKPIVKTDGLSGSQTPAKPASRRVSVNNEEATANNNLFNTNKRRYVLIATTQLPNGRTEEKEAERYESMKQIISIIEDFQKEFEIQHKGQTLDDVILTGDLGCTAYKRDGISSQTLDLLVKEKKYESVYQLPSSDNDLKLECDGSNNVDSIGTKFTPATTCENQNGDESSCPLMEDYIFHSGNLKLKDVLWAPSGSNGAEKVLLPSNRHPSHHLSTAAHFEF